MLLFSFTQRTVSLAQMMLAHRKLTHFMIQNPKSCQFFSVILYHLDTLLLQHVLLLPQCAALENMCVSLLSEAMNVIRLLGHRTSLNSLFWSGDDVPLGMGHKLAAG